MLTKMRLKDIWNDLPELEYTKKYYCDKSKMLVYEVCGRKFQETVDVKYVLDILKKIEGEYGLRAQKAKDNHCIDWKAVSHAIRAAFQVKQLLTENTITFPLKEAPFLLDVKLGKLDYTTEVAPILEGLMEEVEQLSLISTLPEQADQKFWDNFLISTLEKELFKC